MKPAKPLPWRGIAISLAILSLLLGSRLYEASRALKSAFHYHCTITLIDAKTNTQLKVTNTSGPNFSSSDLIKSYNSLSYGPDGTVTVYGIACQPKTIGVGSEGYETAEITITAESPREIRVPLHAKS